MDKERSYRGIPEIAECMAFLLAWLVRRVLIVVTWALASAETKDFNVSSRMPRSLWPS